MTQRNATGEESGAPITGTIPIPPRPGARVFCEIAEYTQGRPTTGTTVFDVPLLVDRKVHLWTIDGGEHLLILEQDRSFLYWEATLERLDDAKKRACDWLTEPPVRPP